MKTGIARVYYTEVNNTGEENETELIAVFKKKGGGGKSDTWYKESAALAQIIK